MCCSALLKIALLTLRLTGVFSTFTDDKLVDQNNTELLLVHLIFAASSFSVKALIYHGHISAESIFFKCSLS